MRTLFWQLLKSIHSTTTKRGSIPFHCVRYDAFERIKMLCKMYAVVASVQLSERSIAARISVRHRNSSLFGLFSVSRISVFFFQFDENYVYFIIFYCFFLLLNFSPQTHKIVYFFRFQIQIYVFFSFFIARFYIIFPQNNHLVSLNCKPTQKTLILHQHHVAFFMVFSFSCKTIYVTATIISGLCFCITCNREEDEKNEKIIKIIVL